MGKTIVFANQKGGVGKTTSAINIAAALGQAGKRTLLCDIDPQGNASSGVGVRRKKLGTSMYDVLIGRSTAAEAIRETGFDKLWVLPSSMPLAAAELELAQLDGRESKLRDALEAVKADYDYIIIDCPPSLGLLTLNALVAGDGVVIPMQCEYFALEGLSQIMNTVRSVRNLYNPGLLLTGILITMYNGRLNLSLQVLEEMKKYYAVKLFSNAVPRSVKLSEAPSYGQPIQYYDRYGKGALIYNELAKELLSRI